MDGETIVIKISKKDVAWLSYMLGLATAAGDVMHLPELLRISNLILEQLPSEM